MDRRPAEDAGATSPGRRYATLIFADLSRSTELAAEMEAEHYAELLAALRGAYQEVIPRHGGLVVRVQGDGLLAMFGHPVTREDDGRRAVEAALELRESVRRMRVVLPEGFALALHTGIHSGLVFVGAGDIERGRFELLGPVPNIAARLSDAAAAHEILVSEETLGPAKRYFKASSLEMYVKGRDAPIHAHRVDARADVEMRLEPQGRPGRTPFIGRRTELERLEHLLALAMAGQPHSVAVVGAPGLGKTRLAHQLLEHAAALGCRVMRGDCESEFGTEPLQPFRQILAAGREALPSSVDAIAAALGEMAAELPLVLFIDDWQWADDASAQVLVALRRLPPCRLLTLLSMRPSMLSEPAPAAAEKIALDPLSDGEVADAVTARLPGADPFVVAEICLQAGGNPLYVEELCHSIARGDPGRRAGRFYAGSAGWMNQLVESRVQRLPAAQIQLVRTAAVIGNVVPIWLLQSLTGCGEEDADVRALAEHDFLYPDVRVGQLRFKHGITRDVIYESVGLRDRQGLHRRVADALRQRGAAAAQEEALEALAWHFDAAGDAAQAAHYAERAGDRALAASALDRARSQYRAALAALDRVPLTADVARRWVAIMERLGLVCMFDPSRGELALAQRAVMLAEEHGDLAMLARVRHSLCYIHYALGEPRAALAHGERALRESRQASDEPLAVQTVATLGYIHTIMGRYDRAIDLLDHAIAVKRYHRSGRRTNTGLVYSLVCRAVALGDRGLFEPAQSGFDEALDCIIGTHEIGATTHGWRATVLLWQGRWADAREAAAESARIAEATRSLSQLSIARAIGGYAAWMLERRSEALQTILDATAWLEPRKSGLFRSLNHGWLADGLVDSGRAAEARQHAARALLRARERDLIGVAMSQRAMSRAAAARGRFDAARRYLERAYAIARERDSAHEFAVTRLCEATLLLQTGERARARLLLVEAESAFERMQMHWHRAEAARLSRVARA